ncbi:MAG: peptidase M16 [Bacteroidetes bacterium GWF2_43_63]|nr:MAG: peptidase M16 [Bacteroidetes bacterium GWE2_42_42]OFY53519.1 MAG: peptidase M16 [Bacteroidetes bacterium GWF2_43_63]HBG71156.1 peptidase M16 [Bacteroidales bacterium]HCB63734.1 peptidase M16 [Bacteroidales bacterium]HCY24483.1 peptidase M16 [Bacteroidales bacterium]
MLQFEKFTLSNGLKVLVYNDKTTPMAVVNILYGVGARDEDENRTGFAHLFEHLMFGGSINIPEYDTPLEKVGGENNAFTNNDITNYHITLPAQNIETAFWLESDRMLSLAFSEKSLEVQRKVVIEEFKQRYLNQPYGDAWLYLRPLAYKEHPYKWSTIGKELSHIENATMSDVRAFYDKWYNPANAIMVVTGPLETDTVRKLAEKWFGSINKTHAAAHNVPQEPEQNEKRELTLERDVPFRALYQAYHMAGRENPDYKVCDLISDLLSNGASSRLYQNLVKDKNYFSGLNGYITGDYDPGLFVIHGELTGGYSFNDVIPAIKKEIEEIKKGNFSDRELEKVKNKIESTFEFSKTSCLNNAMNLAYNEWMGDADRINHEVAKYRAITREDICRVATSVFRDENLSQLLYEPRK